MMNIRIAFLLFVVACSQICFGMRIVDMPLNITASHKAHLEVADPIIVWQDYRNGNWDIYAYNVATKTELPICVAPGDQTNPAVCMSDTDGWNSFVYPSCIITWEDAQSGEPVVHAAIASWDSWVFQPYTLNTWGIFQEYTIDNDIAKQRNPVVSDGYVFWLDDRNSKWEIYGCPLARPYEQWCFGNDPFSDCSSPVISKDILFYNVKKNGGLDINWSYGDNSRVTSGPRDERNVSFVFNYFAVWEDNRNGNWDIFGNFMGDNPGADLVFASSKDDELSPNMFGDPRSSDCVLYFIVKNANRCAIRLADKFTQNTSDLLITDVNLSSLKVINSTNSTAEPFMIWLAESNGFSDIHAAYLCRFDNDNCGICQQQIYENIPFYGTTKYKFATISNSPCGKADGVDAWHLFIPAKGGAVTISTQGSSFDTTVAVYNGPVVNGGPEPVCLACNDDYSAKNVQAKLTLTVTKGKKYYIRVAGTNNQTGDYKLLITPGVCSAVIEADLNDDCKVDMRDFAILADEWSRSVD